jgi:hypothetical protein
MLLMNMKKHFKDRNTDIADQLRCGRPRTAATERNKQKVDELIRQDRRITVREIAAQLGVGHRAVQEMMEIFVYHKICSIWVCLGVQRNTNRLGTALPSTLQAGFGPLRLPLVRALERSSGLTRQSMKPCEAGCEELERTSTTEVHLRFCSAGRNA